MTDNAQAPATKQDIGLLMETLGVIRQDMHDMKQEMGQEIKASEDRSHHNFMIIAEDLRHDLIGIHTDKIQDHEDRIRILEGSVVV